MTRETQLHKIECMNEGFFLFYFVRYLSVFKDHNNSFLNHTGGSVMSSHTAKSYTLLNK